MVKAGRGTDYVYTYGDGESDTVYCGPGYDTVYYDYTDYGDTFYGCEYFYAV